jgi:hypothetical protein
VGRVGRKDIIVLLAVELTIDMSHLLHLLRRDLLDRSFHYYTIYYILFTCFYA